MSIADCDCNTVSVRMSVIRLAGMLIITHVLFFSVLASRRQSRDDNTAGSWWGGKLAERPLLGWWDGRYNLQDAM